MTAIKRDGVWCEDCPPFKRLSPNDWKCVASSIKTEYLTEDEINERFKPEEG